MKILLILGHPNKDTLCGEILNFYSSLLNSQGHEIREIFLGDMNFNPNLSKGYNEIQELEPDLKKAQDSVFWADHLIFVFPIWWYNFPAILKGFIDRVFLPGFAFKYKPNSSISVKLLQGKTADIICTSGAPKIYYFLKGGNSGAKILKNILNFCGIKIRKKILFGSVIKDMPAGKVDKFKKIISKIIIK